MLADVTSRYVWVKQVKRSRLRNHLRNQAAPQEQTLLSASDVSPGRGNGVQTCVRTPFASFAFALIVFREAVEMREQSSVITTLPS